MFTIEAVLVKQLDFDDTIYTFAYHRARKKKVDIIVLYLFCKYMPSKTNCLMIQNILLFKLNDIVLNKNEMIFILLLLCSLSSVIIDYLSKN